MRKWGPANGSFERRRRLGGNFHQSAWLFRHELISCTSPAIWMLHSPAARVVSSFARTASCPNSQRLAKQARSEPFKHCYPAPRCGLGTIRAPPQPGRELPAPRHFGKPGDRFGKNCARRAGHRRHPPPSGLAAAISRAAPDIRSESQCFSRVRGNIAPRGEAFRRIGDSSHGPRSAGVSPAGWPGVPPGDRTGGETPPALAAEDGCATLVPVQGFNA